MIGHVGDVGTVIKVRVDENGAALDVSGATVKQILLKPPQGVVRTKTADFTSDGSDGYIQYTAISGDFDLAGEWLVQAFVTLPAGSWYTKKGAFQLKNHL